MVKIPNSTSKIYKNQNLQNQVLSSAKEMQDLGPSLVMI